MEKFRKETIKSLNCIYCSGQLFNVSFFDDTPGSESGILSCPICKRWYPISEGIVEILPDDKIDWDFRERFHQKVKDQHHEEKVERALSFKFKSSNKSSKFGFSERMVNVYDDIAVNTPFWEKVEAHFINKWLSIFKNIEKKEMMLEVGCGTGRTTEKFAEAGFHIVGLDITFGMIEKAQRKALKKGLISNILYIVADADHIPFSTDTFKGCIFSGFLHHVDNPIYTLKEMRRILIRGGLICGFDNHKSKVRWLFDILMKIFPLWKEEGGTHQTISIPMLYSWGKSAGINFNAVPYCYVPPHLYKLMSKRMADSIFDRTNSFFRSNNFLRKFGGLLDIEGVALRRTDYEKSK